MIFVKLLRRGAVSHLVGDGLLLLQRVRRWELFRDVDVPQQRAADVLAGALKRLVEQLGQAVLLESVPGLFYPTAP